ncbi:MAG TPA: MFS transporter [Nitrospirota bacterium]|nr:MFS transporter [Nitrospirota bacterium]
MSRTVEITSDVLPRLDRLPWSRWHLRVVSALGFGWLLDSLEANIIGSVLGILKDLWKFSPLQGSLTVSAWLIGVMVGAVVFGYLSDRSGRKKIFIITLVWYGLFTLACAFSTNIWVFIFLRFMAAVGIGGEYAAISSAVVEFVPRNVRGRTDAFIMSLWPVGAVCSALLVMFALSLFPPQIAWRAGFLLALVLALFALYVRRRLPESPRWLLERSRFEEAQAVVAAAEKEVMKSKGLTELPPAPPITIRQGEHGVWHETRLLYSKYLARVALGSALNFAQVALGYGSIAFASLVLFPMTNTPPDRVPFFMMIAFLFAFLGGLTSVFMVDTLGRKATGILSYGSYLIAGFSMLFASTPFSALVALCIMQFCYTWGWITEYVIKSEIFPTHVRAAGIGWATFFGRIGGVIAAPVLTSVYQSTGSIATVAFVFAAIVSPGFIAAVFWAVKGVEGKRKALEELLKD